MKTTSVSLLLRIAVVAIFLGWLFDTGWQILTGMLFRWAWGSWAAILIADVAIFAWAWSVRHRLPRKIMAEGKLTVQRAVAPLSPIVAARTAALALAGSRTGAAVGGFYFGCALYARFDSEIDTKHSTISVATTLLCLIMIAVSLWLEHRCQLPPNGDLEVESVSS